MYNNLLDISLVRFPVLLLLVTVLNMFSLIFSNSYFDVIPELTLPLPKPKPKEFSLKDWFAKW
jgi:hypothetical protein